MSTKNVLLVLSTTFIVGTSSALYIYLIGGVYKDFPSIGLTKAEVDKRGFNFFSSTDNIHIHYNESVRKLDRDFKANSTLPKVLVVGNSYGRDVVNIFKESSISSAIEISYFDIGMISKDRETIINRWQDADVIVYAAKTFKDKQWFKDALGFYDKDLEKLICFGTKDFGYSNGIHYNKLSTIEYFSTYFASMKDGIDRIEADLQTEWGDKYISLLQPLLNEDNKIRIFTDAGLFISQDTLHLTKAGAVFYAELLEIKLNNIFKIS